MPRELSALIAVRTYELDSFGHVNNSVYLNYLEEARSEYLKQGGLSFHDFVRLGVQLVIAEVNIQFLKPAVYGDTVDVRGLFYDVKGASIRLKQTLVATERGVTLAVAQTHGVFFNPQTGRPTRVPAPFLQAWQEYEGEAEP